MRIKRKESTHWHGVALGRQVLRLKKHSGGKAKSGFHPARRALRHRRAARALLRVKAYFLKMLGKRSAVYEFSLVDTCWSFIGGFLGMLLLAVLNIYILERHNQNLLLGSFGASAMLVFGAPHAPFAQPFNVIGGHILSALIGVFAQTYFGFEPWLAASLAVSLSIAAMQASGTMHPPGGATALIAVVGGEELKSFGYSYAFVPVGLSAAVLVCAAVIINNLSRRRRYPLYWW